MKTIDLIVSDLDDTLLNDEGVISPFTAEVLRRAIRRGIRLVPASGRTMASMRPIVEPLHTGMPYIGGNGSEIISAGHTLLEQLTLDLDTARDICRQMAQRGIYAQVYAGDTFYYGAECEASRKYRRSSGMRGVAVGDLAAFLDFPTPKVLCVAEPEEVARLQPLMNERYRGRAAFTVSKPYFLEAEPPGASKGEALRRLSRYLPIDPERTLAFGDSLNDLSLLAFTPHSVAVENARPELKQAAAYVCGPNTQDGPARFVLEHVLNDAESR